MGYNKLQFRTDVCLKTAVLLILLLAIATLIPINITAVNAKQINPSFSRPLHLNSTLGMGYLRTSASNDPHYFSMESYRPLPPSSNPIVVNIANNALFASSGTTPQEFNVFIPAISASTILLNVTIRETGGPQYDRPFYVYANGVPLLWGSTQEIFNSTALVDVTYYEYLLRGTVRFDIILINYLAPQIGITGVYYVNATLYIYPGKPPVGLPNAFIPLFPNQNSLSLVRLNPSTSSALMNINIPTGTYRMATLLYTEGLGLDEFWYAILPAIRNVLIYYDNLLAGVVQPYETIYTGGISPFYWRPITSVNTLAFHSSYIIDLTPMLALGQTGTLNVTVTNLKLAAQLTGPSLGWYISGVLLLWVNPSNPLQNGSLYSYNAKYFDSGPEFSGESYLIYDERGNYSITVASNLNFLYGQENAVFRQVGSFSTHQLIGETFQNLTLTQTTIISSVEQGFYSATQFYEISYPITLDSSFEITPIDNPNQIPYRALYTEIDFVNPSLSYYSVSTFGSYRESKSISENVAVNGEFSFLLLIINQYGGAIILGITYNYADTKKFLQAIDANNYGGWEELYYAEALVNSPTQRYGNLTNFILIYLQF